MTAGAVPHSAIMVCRAHEKSLTAMGFAAAATQIASIFEFGGAMLLGRVVTNTIAGGSG